MMAEIRAENARLRHEKLGLRLDKRQLERDKLASDKTTVAQLKEWLSDGCAQQVRPVVRLCQEGRRPELGSRGF